MGAPLTDVEFAELLRTFQRDAFRLELQPAYAEPSERDTVAKFLTGNPEPPTAVPDLRAWFDQITELTRQGKRIERVRVHDDPPTPYQQWERWIGAWNTAAGEMIRYMTRGQAYACGLLPAVGDLDWWLLDSARLIVMRFDEQGHRVRSELVTDSTNVAQACVWRDVAVRYSVPDQVRGAAA